MEYNKQYDGFIENTKGLETPDDVQGLQSLQSTVTKKNSDALVYPLAEPLESAVELKEHSTEIVSNHELHENNQQFIR